MGKIVWLKLMSSLNITGKSQRECDGYTLTSKANVHEEYQEAFRTKSYIEMWSKVEGQLGKTAKTRQVSSSSSPSSSLPFVMNLTECLLEPPQETVEDMQERFGVHHLLLDYFANSLEACRNCDIILEGIHQTRVYYQKIKRGIKLSKALDDHHRTHQIKDRFYKSLNGELAAFASHKNPMSVITPTKFRDIHDRFDDLLRKLTSERRKINRRRKFKTFCKKVAGMGLVLSHSALLIALLIFALHSVVGIISAPGILGCLVGLMKKKKVGRMKKGSSEKLGEQLDVAAKGVYILINDFDTMSRMVKRLHDEVEHCRSIVRMCLNNRNSEMLMEVVRERADEPSFLDQLEELEEHIYLCFLTVNRSRRLVIQEIMEK